MNDDDDSSVVCVVKGGQVLFPTTPFDPRHIGIPPMRPAPAPAPAPVTPKEVP